MEVDTNKLLLIALGHLRGKFTANERIKAFRLAYDREPNFWSDPEPKVESDFSKACKLVNTKLLYDKFSGEVNFALYFLDLP